MEDEFEIGQKSRESYLEVSVRGAVAGAVGAGCIALFFMVLDTTLREPFYSPSLLGTALFEGSITSGFTPSLEHVGAYTWVHGMAFMMIGLIAAHAMNRFSLLPASLVSFLLILGGLQAGYMGATHLLGAGVADAIGQSWALIGNLFATMGMSITLLAFEGMSDSTPEGLAARSL